MKNLGLNVLGDFFMSLASYVEFFDLTFSKNNTIFFLIEENTKKIITANAKAIEFIGYSKSEIQNFKFDFFSSNKNIEKQKLSSNPIKSNFLEITLIKKNGAAVNTLINVAPLIIENKKYQLLSIDEDFDISRTETFNHCNKIEHFFNYSPDLLCILDSEGYIVKFNQAWRILLGYNESDIYGRKAI